MSLEASGLEPPCWPPASAWVPGPLLGRLPSEDLSPKAPASSTRGRLSPLQRCRDSRSPAPTLPSHGQCHFVALPTALGTLGCGQPDPTTLLLLAQPGRCGHTHSCPRLSRASVRVTKSVSLVLVLSPNLPCKWLGSYPPGVRGATSCPGL